MAVTPGCSHRTPSGEHARAGSVGRASLPSPEEQPPRRVAAGSVGARQAALAQRKPDARGPVPAGAVPVRLLHTTLPGSRAN